MQEIELIKDKMDALAYQIISERNGSVDSQTLLLKTMYGINKKRRELEIKELMKQK
jgi:hypothetical protein